METREQIYINIESLKASTYNNYEIVDIPKLKNSIYSCGLTTPLSVIGPDEDDKYIILSGERRYTAMKELIAENANNSESLKNVPCLVLGPVDMPEAKQKLIIEVSNLETREDVDRKSHYFKVIEHLKELSENGEISERKIASTAAKYFNTTTRYAKMYQTIFVKGGEELTSMAKEGKVSLNNAERIANMQEDNKKQAIKDLQDGINEKEVVKKFSGQREFTLDELNKVDVNFGNDGLSIDGNVDSSGEFDNLNKARIDNSAEMMGNTSEEGISDTFEADFAEDINVEDTLNVKIPTADDLVKEETKVDNVITNAQANKTTSIEKYKELRNNEYKDFLKKMVDWCKIISEKDDLTEEEFDVIVAFEGVMNKHV